MILNVIPASPPRAVEENRRAGINGKETIERRVSTNCSQTFWQLLWHIRSTLFFTLTNFSWKFLFILINFNDFECLLALYWTLTTFLTNNWSHNFSGKYRVSKFTYTFSIQFILALTLPLHGNFHAPLAKDCWKYMKISTDVHLAKVCVRKCPCSFSKGLCKVHGNFCVLLAKDCAGYMEISMYVLIDCEFPCTSLPLLFKTPFWRSSSILTLRNLRWGKTFGRRVENHKIIIMSKE